MRLHFCFARQPGEPKNDTARLRFRACEVVDIPSRRHAFVPVGQEAFRILADPSHRACTDPRCAGAWPVGRTSSDRSICRFMLHYWRDTQMQMEFVVPGGTLTTAKQFVHQLAHGACATLTFSA